MWLGPDLAAEISAIAQAVAHRSMISVSLIPMHLRGDDRSEAASGGLVHLQSVRPAEITKRSEVQLHTCAGAEGYALQLQLLFQAGAPFFPGLGYAVSVSLSGAEFRKAIRGKPSDRDERLLGHSESSMSCLSNRMVDPAGWRQQWRRPACGGAQ
jgi:hypothetical protein